MNILMTNHGLSLRGGTELFIAEVAGELKARGHRIAIFSSLTGQIADELCAKGIPVVRSPDLCPFMPDLIHGQHHLETMAALCFWPGVPALYFVHGATPWEEYPPEHPMILKYVCTSPRSAWWIARECGIGKSDVGVVRNFFNPSLFTKVRTPLKRPKRALVFHNLMEPGGKPFEALKTACRTAQMELDAIGVSFGRTIAEPQNVLPDYDVVFAGGRSAIESMACGCAAIPITKTTIAPMVTTENFDAMRDINFCSDANDPQIEPEVVLERLRAFDAASTATVTHRIRSEATLDASLGALLNYYAKVLSLSSIRQVGFEERQRSLALGRYLVSIAERIRGIDEKRLQLLAQKERATESAEKWKNKALNLAERRFPYKKPNLGRRLLRMLDLGWAVAMPKNGNVKNKT